MTGSLLFSFLITLGCSSGTDSTQKALLAFEGGFLYKAEKIHVAQLNGDYKEMGRQYGYLLKSQIESYYETAINDHPPWGGNWSREKAEEFARGNYKNQCFPGSKGTPRLSQVI